jgi:Fis family transcriptional regulator, factor for inversion stimulation protein
MHSSGVSYDEAVRAFRRQYLCEVMLMNRGNRCRTAAELGVHRNTITRIATDLGIGKQEIRTALKKQPRGAIVPATGERKVSA